MNRKTVLGIIIVLLAGGGIFWRIWQNQADVRALNKTLPSGIRVTKSLFGNEYRVVNKIDGYSFKIPSDWRRIGEIIYTPKRTVSGFEVISLTLTNKDTVPIDITIDLYSTDTPPQDLKKWSENLFKVFELSGDFEKTNIGTIESLKTQETEHLFGTYIYIFRNKSSVYVISGPSERFIQEIIINGNWSLTQ